MSRFQVDAYDVPPSLEDMSPEYPDRLSLFLSDGSELSKTVAHVKGGGQAPMGEVEICEKFTLCGGDPALLETILNGPSDTIVNPWMRGAKN